MNSMNSAWLLAEILAVKPFEIDQNEFNVLFAAESRNLVRSGVLKSAIAFDCWFSARGG